MLKRRSFLAGILAASVAPAFVRSGVLMPVKEIWVPNNGYAFTFGPRIITFPSHPRPGDIFIVKGDDLLLKFHGENLASGACIA